MHEVASLTLFQGLQLQVSVIPNDKTTTVTGHLGCPQLYIRGMQCPLEPRESYNDMTEYHGYESVHDPKALIGIVDDDDDDDDPGTC